MPILIAPYVKKLLEKITRNNPNHLQYGGHILYWIQDCVTYIYIGDRQKEDQNMMTYNHQFQGHEKNAL